MKIYLKKSNQNKMLGTMIIRRNLIGLIAALFLPFSIYCQSTLCNEGEYEVEIIVGGGSWQEEVSWDILETSISGQVGTYNICLSPGCYTFNMYDSYGDGWNGNVVTIANSDIYSNTLEVGFSGTFIFGVNESSCVEDYYGCDGEWVEDIVSYNCSSFNSSEIECISHAGCWFEENAYVGVYLWEDRCYGGTHTIDNSYCDGEMVTVIYGCTDENAVNYNSNASEDNGSCYYESDIYGCIDQTAYNYNEDATIDDGSCLNVIEGCTNESAINYNANANTEDGSCSFENDSGCQNIYITLNNGWNMIGFACAENTNAALAFDSIQDKIIIAKDGIGNAYLPDWDFNGIGDLEKGYGYLLKVTEEINNYNICE